MRLPIFFLFLLLFQAILFNNISEAKPSMGFGFLANRSDDSNFNYLETIFPNSFASSLKNIFDIEVIKPYSINERLKKYKMKLKREYKPYELPELIKKIDSDIFVYGNFMPLAGDRVKIVLHFYRGGTNKLFTFTNVGKMETEIFKLVDRITNIISKYIHTNKVYRKKAIPGGSRLAIITNLKNDELNLLYAPFLKKNYRIAGFQGNSMSNITTMELIKPFRYIHTRDNSYDIIPKNNKIVFFYGPWANEKYIKKTLIEKNIQIKYNFDYTKTKEKILDRIIKSYKGNIDNILIIGFNDNKTEAWIRCIDIRKKDLIWMQENITGKSITSIADKIIDYMSMPLREKPKVK